MRKLFLCFTVLLTAFPAIAQDAAQAAPATATVYFYRLREFYGSALKPSIFCDKTQVARMRNGRFLSVTLPPGPHTITSTFPGSGIDVNLEPGKTYYVRLEMSRPGFVHSARGEVTEVPPDQGKFEVSQLKSAEPVDLKAEDAGQ